MRNHKKTKVYWWKKVENFGDGLTPLLLTRFAYLENIQWVPIMNADIISVGSILEHVPENWKGIILGSGLLRESSKLKFNPCSNDIKILALRGPLSSKNIPGNFALGDPAILSNELIQYQEKKWDLGIVPHWQDTELAEKFLNIIPKKFTCKVIHPIASCRRIVTSSLHGMIVADSIGIPRRVEECNALKNDGGIFKFLDYNAAIHCPFEIGKMIEADRNRVDDVKFEIYDAFIELRNIYEKY